MAPYIPKRHRTATTPVATTQAPSPTLRQRFGTPIVDQIPTIKAAIDQAAQPSLADATTEDTPQSLPGTLLGLFTHPTVAKWRAMGLGVGEGMTNPETIANATAMAVGGPIGMGANLAIAGSGAYDAADSNLSVGQRLMGAANTIGGLFGAGHTYAKMGEVPKGPKPPTLKDVVRGADMYTDVAGRQPAPTVGDIVPPVSVERGVNTSPIVSQGIATDSPRVQKVVANEAKATLASATQEARNLNAKDKFIVKGQTQDAKNMDMARKFMDQASTQEAKNLNARDKFLISDNTQTARNLNAADKYTANQKALDKIASRQQGLESTVPTVSETVRGKTEMGSKSSTQKFVQPEPDASETDLYADPETPVDPTSTPGLETNKPLLSKPTKPSSVSGTKRYFPGTAAGKKDAIAAAQNRGMNVLLNDAGNYEIIPFERRASDVPTQTGSLPSQTFRTWAEARGAQKTSGGDIVGDIKTGFSLKPHAEAPPTEAVPAADTVPKAPVVSDTRMDELVQKFGGTAKTLHVGAADEPVIPKTAIDELMAANKPTEPLAFTNDMVDTADGSTVPAGTAEGTPHITAGKTPEEIRALRDEAQARFDQQTKDVTPGETAPRGVIPVREAPLDNLDEVMDSTGVTAGQRPFKPGNVVASPPSGVVLSDNFEGTGNAWNREKFGGAEPSDSVPLREPTEETPYQPSTNVENPATAQDQIAAMQNDLNDPEVPEDLKGIIRQWLKDNGGSTKGAAPISVATHAASTAAGALGGAAYDKDHPGRGALLGGAAGALAPSAIRGLINAAQSGTMNTDGLKDLAKKAEDTLVTGLRLLPDWQRFSLLFNTKNLPINAFVGPWGGSVMAALEHALQGDERGVAALKLFLNPNLMNENTFMRKWWTDMRDAGLTIEQSATRAEGENLKNAPKWFRMVTGRPGQAMTAGDFAARDLLMQAGFTEEEARKITLTSEPYTPTGQAISKMKKGAQTAEGKKSWWINMMLPFFRTNLNQVEQGLERTPGIGIFINKYGKGAGQASGAWKQVVQQGMGGVVSYSGYQLGLNTDVEDAPLKMKLIQDFGGQYGMLATAGFLVGQAEKSGKEPWDAFTSVMGSIAQNMPLPTAKPLTDMASTVKKIATGQKANGDPLTATDYVPSSMWPQALRPDTLTEGANFLGSATGNTPVKSGRRPYVPTHKTLRRGGSR